MRTVGEQKIWSYCNNDADPSDELTNDQVRAAPGHEVHSYLELARKVARLQFLNPDLVFLFRGQSKDYRNQQYLSSLKPTLLRPTLGALNPAASELIARFDVLSRAEFHLLDIHAVERLENIESMKRYRILRWAILQHYEVCATPLLDVSQSLRISASFASMSEHGEGFLYVIGVPNISGAITASAEAGLQIIRLSSVCPPGAVRPHIQEGYLLGEYPDMVGIEQKNLYAHYETDFGRRLVGKFRFLPQEFWQNNDFPLVPAAALYPSEQFDPMCKIALDLKARLQLAIPRPRIRATRAKQ